MPCFSYNSTPELVRYKRQENKAEHDAEVLISTSLRDLSSSEGKERSFFRMNNRCCQACILTVLVILFSTLGAIYYSKDSWQIFLHHSCAPIQHVDKVIIETEVTDSGPCLNNKTCHSFLNTIEQRHDGMNVNFVIGPRGELYVGAGFKCLVKNNENSLYVKVLRNKNIEPFNEYLRKCIRLSEIIDHGISCGKISPSYQVDEKMETCTILESNKIRQYHVHDPSHDVKLVHGDFRWTYCGNFSTTRYAKKDKVVTPQNLQENLCATQKPVESWPEDCLPLQIVGKIKIDIVEVPKPRSADPSCLSEYEENHEGLKYNFIISHSGDTYVGLGFKCQVDSTFNNSLRIKLLLDKELSYNDDQLFNLPQLKAYLLLLEEGIFCGKFSDRFSVDIKNGNFGYEMDYESYKNIQTIRQKLNFLKVDFGTLNSTNISADGRQILPRQSRYQICSRNSTQDTTTMIPEPSPKLGTLGGKTSINWNTSCTQIQKIHQVKVMTEYMEYPCSKNNTCPSLLETIEREHDGENYNFVIGPGGELYIGAGFRCVIDNQNKELKTLYVKLLKDKNRAPLYVSDLDYEIVDPEEDSPICSRFEEIIQQGILCEKIIRNYYVDAIHFYGPHPHLLCVNVGKGPKKTQSHYLHDPDYKMGTLVPANLTWTFCGDESHNTVAEHDMTIARENSTNFLCSPLQLVDEIIVEVVWAPSFECSDDLPCLNLFEENHNGLNYNFIIGHDLDVYVGLGYNCKANNTNDNVLKIKILEPLDHFEINKKITLSEGKKCMQIIEEGIACGKIAQEFRINGICDVPYGNMDYRCTGELTRFTKAEVLKDFLILTEELTDYENYNLSSNHGSRVVVPANTKYQHCFREHLDHTTATEAVPEPDVYIEDNYDQY